jgi:hypothetical protein
LSGGIVVASGWGEKWELAGANIICEMKMAQKWRGGVMVDVADVLIGLFGQRI